MSQALLCDVVVVLPSEIPDSAHRGCPRFVCSSLVQPPHLHSFPTRRSSDLVRHAAVQRRLRCQPDAHLRRRGPGGQDRKSTRLNSSHTVISYAVFCLKKKKIAYAGGAPDHPRLAAEVLGIRRASLETALRLL